jgi:serine phosphatase RsbU (regulator of sigma subunit)/anti-sigma regulatory factor (Ser/Thr protein kinase)
MLERLRRLEAVTDAALSRLSFAELLDELLTRIREILEVDTAAVLLLDQAKGELVATAAKGLEEEVEQGVRIPYGEGFAGRVAKERTPVVLRRVGPDNVVNQILLNKGIRSMLGVPLQAEGEVLGVLHVGSLVERDFQPGDVELLQLVAERVALALRVRMAERARVALEAFQRAFMPESLPQVPGLRIASRYLPAASLVGVGGDWYDAFHLVSGDVLLVMGDVAGHGLGAATVMAKVRTALRAYAVEGHGLAEIADRVDAFVRQLDDEEIVTLLLGVLDADLTTFRFVAAGHVPPLVVTPDEASFAWGGSRTPPLGLARSFSIAETTVPLERGTSLLLYTDGLVERRDEPLDVSLERLRATAAPLLRSHGPVGAIGGLVAAAFEDRAPADDVAVMVVQRLLNAAPIFEILRPARARSLGEIRRSLKRWLDDAGVPLDVRDDVVTASGEACANAIEHAYGPSGGMIRILARLTDEALELEILDTGRWREPRPSDRGKGLDLMRGLMDDVEIERMPGGTTVRMRRRVR